MQKTKEPINSNLHVSKVKKGGISTMFFVPYMLEKFFKNWLKLSIMKNGNTVMGVNNHTTLETILSIYGQVEKTLDNPGISLLTIHLETF